MEWQRCPAPAGCAHQRMWGRPQSGTGHTKTHLHRDTKHPFPTKHHSFSGEKDGKEISQYQKEILMQKLKGELALSWLSKNRTGNCK